LQLVCQKGKRHRQQVGNCGQDTSNSPEGLGLLNLGECIFAPMHRNESMSRPCQKVYRSFVKLDDHKRSLSGRRQSKAAYLFSISRFSPEAVKLNNSSYRSRNGLETTSDLHAIQTRQTRSDSFLSPNRIFKIVTR